MSDRIGEGYFKRAVNNQWVTIGRLMVGRRSERVLSSTAVAPVYSSIMLTQNCNYKCVMCSFWHRKSQGELTLEELQRLTGALRALGVAQVNFTGGEPFLRQDLTEIVRATKSHGFRMIQITTNGSLATEERLEELFSAGLGRIAMSVDGVGTNHEQQRGVPGAWKRCIRTLDALRKLRESRFPGLEVELAMVISKLNMGDLDEVLRICKEYRAVLHLQFLDNVQFFTAEVNHQQYALSPPEVDALMSRVHWHIDNSPGIDPLLTHQGLEYVRRYLKREDPNRDLPRAACAVGYALLYFDAHGNLYPGCFSMAPIGNIRERPLAELVDSPQHRRVARDQFKLNCPGCPNGYAWNVFTNPRALARELAGRLRQRVLPVVS